MTDSKDVAAIRDALVLLFRKGEENPDSIYGPMTDKEAEVLGGLLVDSIPGTRALLTNLSPPPFPANPPREYDPVLEAELERVMTALPYRVKSCLGREALAGYAMAQSEQMDCFTLNQMRYPERYGVLLEHIQRVMPVREDKSRVAASAQER